VGTLPLATEHVPLPTVKLALEEVDRLGADALLALGGGSAIGLGKAVAAERSLRLLVVPTTYSGSEMTSIYGVTDANEKRTARAERVRPALVLYDAMLTTALPAATSITSAWNAMAHCVEALWWPDADPLALLAAEHGMRALVSAVPVIASDPQQLAAREQALLGAYLGGIALSDTGTALQHKLAHLLGGAFGLPHASTHAVLLPHVVRYNAPTAPQAAACIADVLGERDPAVGLHALALHVGAPTRLDALGFQLADVDSAVDKLLAAPFANPRPLERAGLRELLRAACDGSV
jgi:maleylacetate reductase